MTGYIIYAQNDLTGEKIAHEINNIKSTIDDLFKDVLKINRCWQKVIFSDINLNLEGGNTMLADIGLGSECTVIICNKILTEDDIKIINEHSKEILEAYKICMEIEDEDVNYTTFSNIYAGHFDTPYKFVDWCLEEEEEQLSINCLPWYLQDCIEREKDYLYEVFMSNYYWERDGHYFWGL